MENKCGNTKKSKRGTKDIDLINKRLNRIIGQLNGIKKMVNDNVYCNDILIQLVAAEKSIKSLSNIILENHLQTCVFDELEKGNLESFDEIISLFKRFNN